jgi:hypothetical protein
MNFLPQSIRNAFGYVWSLIVSADYRKEEFNRIFNVYEYDQTTQIVGFINYLGMSNQLDVSKNFHLFANAKTLQDAVTIWENYKGGTYSMKDYGSLIN